MVIPSVYVYVVGSLVSVPLYCYAGTLWTQQTEQNANYLIMMLNCFAVYTGAQIQCLECQSSISYDDCQNKTKVVNCSSVNDRACFQADVKFEKGAEKTHIFQKGCLQKSDCEDYNKGDIGACTTQKELGYETDCKAMCCHEDECNREDLLVDKEDNKGSAFAISVMILLSGLLLTLVNIN